MYFVDFLRDPTFDEETGETLDANPSFYESTVSLASIKTVADAKMKVFNETSKSLKLDLVLFEDALKHMMRIARLLAMDRGSALLVGVGGSGKQSLTRLAAYISGAFTFQITISKQYNQAALFEDLKSLYKVAGLKGQKVCFIFTDAEVKEESFLEFINQILMTGEVAGLFPKDELDMIVNDMRPVAKKEKPDMIDTWDNLYAMFLSRVRDNLHTCLCFSPSATLSPRARETSPGSSTGAPSTGSCRGRRRRSSRCPPSSSGTSPWRAQTRTSSSCRSTWGTCTSPSPRRAASTSRSSGRNVYVTPKSYLSFIEGYKDLYTRKLSDVKVLAEKINSGLSKLFEAKNDVKTMQVDLAVKNKDLAKAQADAAVLLKEISANTAIAEKEKAKVNVIVEGVTAKAEEIAAVKQDAEEDLKKAQPALDAAVDALNSIKASDIATVKALKKPPDLIARILDAAGAPSVPHEQDQLARREGPAGDQRAGELERAVHEDDGRVRVPRIAHELPQGSHQRRDVRVPGRVLRLAGFRRRAGGESPRAPPPGCATGAWR